MARRRPDATARIRPHAPRTGTRSLRRFIPRQNDWGGPSLAPIGYVEAALGKESTVVLLPGLESGLTGLDEFSHAVVVYWLHRVAEIGLFHVPESPQFGPIGIFACRCPFRPNALGVAVVELVGVERNRFHVRGLDAWDGTPVLDLKPYVASQDAVPGARAAAWSVSHPEGPSTGSPVVA